MILGVFVVAALLVAFNLYIYLWVFRE